MPKVAVLLSCYKRPEYTERCIRSLEYAQKYDKDTIFHLVDDGSKDETSRILFTANLNKVVGVNESTRGLRSNIIEFFDSYKDYDYIVKMDNDCMVPSNWLNDIIYALETYELDIVSPNVFPSDAASKTGVKDPNLTIYHTKSVGGLWAMRPSLISDIYFENLDARGIKGAYHLLNQIVVEKSPRVAWLENVVVQDMGHWSGAHPDHIASESHREYSIAVGRPVQW